MPRLAKADRRSLLLILAGLACAALPFVGCSSSDDTDSGAADTSTTTDTGSPDAAKTYGSSSITTMRAGASGNFSFDAVLTYSIPGGSRAFVIDVAGGDFSAIQIICNAPCTLASTISGTMDGHKITTSGTYTKTDAAHGSAEQFVPDTWIDDGESATVPQESTVTYAEVVKTASS